MKKQLFDMEIMIAGKKQPLKIISGKKNPLSICAWFNHEQCDGLHGKDEFVLDGKYRIVSVDVYQHSRKVVVYVTEKD